MAQVRGQTYADFAWPPALGALYQRNGLTLSLALAAGLALFLLMALAINGTLTGGNLDGNFYKLFPHNLLVGLFVPVFGFAVLALALGVRKFWREVSPATIRCPGQRAGGGRSGWMTCCASNTSAAAMARAATTKTTPGHCGAGAFTTPPSTVSCCASPPPAWPRCITMSWAGRRRTV
jgi:hypothetical protein